MVGRRCQEEVQVTPTRKDAATAALTNTKAANISTQAVIHKLQR